MTSRCCSDSDTVKVLKQILVTLQQQETFTIGDVTAITESVTPGTSNQNLGKEEDSGHVTGDTGVFFLAVRNDSDADLTSHNLDYSPVAVDSAGRLKFDASISVGDIGSITTSVTPGTAATNLGKAEDTAHTSGDVGVFSLAIRANTPAAPTSGDAEYSGLYVDSLGKLWTAPSQTEDLAHASGDRGSFALAVRNDSATILTSATGDYSGVTVNRYGAPESDINSDYRQSATKSPVKVGAETYSATDTGMAATVWRNTSLNTSVAATSFGIQSCGSYAQALSTLVHDTNISSANQVSRLEDSAHTSGNAGIPVFAVAQATLAASVDTDGDYGNIKLDSLGALWVHTEEVPVASRFKGTTAADVTNTTPTLVVAAPGALLRYNITTLTASNLHATQETRIDIYSAATLVWSGPGASLGGGFCVSFPKDCALACGVNEAINVVCGTTGAKVRASAAGYISA